MNNQPNQIQKPRINWSIIFWIILIIMLISYFSNTFFRPNVVNLPYSEFKNQVKNGNISEVYFKGQEIHGEFKNIYRVQADSKEDSISYSSFKTVKPSFEDPSLVTILEENQVQVNAKKESDSLWIYVVLFLVLPWLFIIGYFVYMRKRIQGQMGQMGGLFNVGKSKARRFRKSSVSVSYEDVAGLENAKKDLREIIEYLKEPEKFAALGADIPKGILMVGPPGTGKTLLARATAGEADVPFYSISGSEFIEMFVGVGASRVRDLFKTAKKEAPSIIFIDELDSVGRARGTGLGGGHDEREQTLNQILSEMDGFAPHESVIVVAATNRPDVLDAALTRPGRFDRQVTLELPQKDARLKILEIHTKDVPLADDVDLENIAARTVTFSGADLRNLVNEAALLAGRDKKKQVEGKYFDQARDKIILGHEREDMIQEEEKEIIAYHEAGHALMAKLIPGADPVQKVTIIPRGRSLGATEQIPEIDRHNISKKYLLNRIAIMLGGRAAEKLIFDDTTTGAANDLKQVTKIARKMITQWGMSEKIGPLSFREGEEHMFLGREMTQAKDYSESTAKIIDQEIRRIVTEMEEKTTQTLQENKDKLKKLAEALLENETVGSDEIDEILKFKKNKKKK